MKATSLVTLTLLTGVGCAYPLPPPDLPVEIQVQDTYSDGEYAAITQSNDEWNAVCDVYLGKKCGHIVGRFHDPDGFTLADLNRQDGHFTYRNSDLESAQELSGNADVFGEGTRDFVVVWADLLRADLMQEVSDQGVAFSEDLYLQAFKSVVEHEYGHHFGVDHVMDDGNRPLMAPAMDPLYPQTGITARDILALCNSRGDCIKDPPKP